MQKILALVIVASFLLSSCKKENNKSAVETTNSSENFDQLLKDYNEGKLLLNPINATFAGDNRFNDQFPNFLSDDYQNKLTQFYTSYKDKLKIIVDSDLTESQKMSKAVLNWDCDMAIAQAGFKNDILLPINQMWTINLTVGQLASGSSAQPFNTVKDYENWLQRLKHYNVWLQSAETRMNEGIQSGYVLPKSLIKKVTPQFEGLSMVNTTKEGIVDLSEHLFYSPITKFPESFSTEEKNKLTEAYSVFLLEQLIPSFKSLHAFLSTDYLTAGREGSGIDGIPQGKEYYQHAIKNYTTTKMTADEIHELGLKEVARILSEMEKVKQQVDFKGSLKEFFDFVRNNKALMPYKEPEQIIDNFNEIHNRMKPQLEKLFGNKPKTPFVVKQTEKFREASASAEYNPGSLDGTRPGVFYTPIPDASKYNVFSDEALFLHEAIPGHHYQISLTQENENLPDFRKTLWYSAYGEGWALYTENLGKELGLYTDPYQYFGMLGMEMHRAIRLVVDTGLHAKGWTREKAIQYSLDNEAESEASIISEIERYMANPGQALSYKIGQLKIRELRAKAKETLGDQFDIREFHNQVLETGCIPLALLENKINNWVQSYQK
ncbi:Uncharacterized conserved protein, DUF885 familyt [Tenacibaculum sp. MAR_2009_124]|uniref:DUF885 domain-containing protein n=1 Tax=Tenacibaculum sp. MAR_2009_124 TaxID=1250059 RepID=UPI00089542C6|nr:DUF885 domain-containing protein [Tenacibaculum sp. MAR_2009_124]SEB44782.1 Uncharacterized conserved protein, DUF885 familyt [Tenacibaculum sp. MAR_2009_124]